MMVIIFGEFSRILGKAGRVEIHDCRKALTPGKEIRARVLLKHGDDHLNGSVLVPTFCLPLYPDYAPIDLGIWGLNEL